MTGEPTGQLRGHVIVCGLNDVGLRIVEQLRAAHEQVAVIDDGSNPRLARIFDTLDVTQLTGDPRRTSTLRAAGIGEAASLICVEQLDLHNLEVALLARELSPGIRVVMQLTNRMVAHAVTGLAGAGSVLDAAELAAPSFVEACLRREDHDISIGNHVFTVTHRRVNRSAALRTIFGDLAPIAVVPASGGELEVCPGRDLVVSKGDVVTLIGSRDDLAAAAERRGATGVDPVDWEMGAGARDSSVHRHSAGPVRRSLARSYRLALSFLLETEKSFRLALTLLAGVGLFSILLLMAGYRGTVGPNAGSGARMGFLDAMYFTVETLTTVGFGDFYFAHQHIWLRLWAIALMIIGATLVTILYALLTNMLITRRLAATAGQRRASALHNHVIVIGLGSVGLRVLEGLRSERRDVVVIERDPANRYLTAAGELGAPVIIGDSTLRQTLEAANLAGASAVAVLTSNDLANIETGLAVDDLLGGRARDVPVVLRIFDRQLAAAIERNFNFRYVRSTSALAAPWFVGAALGLSVLNTFYVEGQPFLVGELDIGAAGGLNGRSMSDLSARTRVIAIARHGHNGAAGALEHPPRRDTRFHAGDRAFVVGPYEELLQLLRHERT